MGSWRCEGGRVGLCGFLRMGIGLELNEWWLRWRRGHDGGVVRLR